jgi:serine/threonine protein kinase
MKPERWEQVAQLHSAALKIEKHGRATFLQKTCAGDEELRREVESLLALEVDAENFMEGSALEAVAKELAEEQRPLRALSSGGKLGSYVIMGELGAGGMGEVYRARDSSLKREVAIKVLPASYSRDPDRLRRFELEAQAAAALNHPNILSILHIGEHDGSPYIVSELLEGQTLGDRLLQGPMRRREAVDVAVAAARGLAAAHEKGIIHRDLKPQNLFLGRDGRVKILDFGLAKLTQVHATADSDAMPTLGTHTEPGLVMGTVGYMSPEQVRGETADARSDIFALGCVLYEMLTGKRAFHKPSSAETMGAILNEDPPELSQATLKIPPALQKVMRRCLEKNPELRFQSASDLAFALEALSDSGSAATAVVGQLPWRRVLPWTAAALVLVAIVVWLYLRRSNSATGPSGSSPSLEIRALTDNGKIFRAAISSDGRYIAYVQSLADKFDLHLLQVATGRDIQLLPESTAPIVNLQFSPDGNFIYLLRPLQDSDALGVFRIATLGGPAAPVVTDASMRSVTVSPDGNQIAYISNTPTESRIVSVDPQGSNRRVLASRPAALGFRYIDWSPSPDTMAAVALMNQSMGIGLLSVDLRSGSTRDVSASGWGTIGQPAWSADGSQIFAPAVAVTQRFIPIMQIWEFDARTGASKPLTSGSIPYQLGTLSATTAGELLANTRSPVMTLWVMDASSQPRLLPSTRSEGWDSVAWVDRQIVTNTYTYPEMVVHDPDGRTTKLRSHSSIYRDLARCGPGNVVYWATDPKRQSHIARTDITTGSTSILTNGPQDGGPVCTPDASTLVYAHCADQGNRCFLTRKSLQSGQSVNLYEFHIAGDFAPAYAISPDGSSVLLTTMPEPGHPYEWTMLIPMDGGAPKKLKLPIAFGEAELFKWAPDGKSILYSRTEGGVGNIWSAALEDKAPRQLTHFDSDRIFAFDVSPDNRLVIARGSFAIDMVLIKSVK